MLYAPLLGGDGIFIYYTNLLQAILKSAIELTQHCSLCQIRYIKIYNNTFEYILIIIGKS